MLPSSGPEHHEGSEAFNYADNKGGLKLSKELALFSLNLSFKGIPADKQMLLIRQSDILEKKFFANKENIVKDLSVLPEDEQFAVMAVTIPGTEDDAMWTHVALRYVLKTDSYSFDMKQTLPPPDVDEDEDEDE